MQGAARNSRELEYYPQIKDIFQDLAVQSNMAYPIPNIAWRTYLSVEEPLTNSEKEESFEVDLYIEIFGP